MILWVMMSFQMVGWAYFTFRGGKLSDKGTLILFGTMMLGQMGAGIETYLLHAWGTLGVQIYFFVFTAYGAIQRYRQMETSPP